MGLRDWVSEKDEGTDAAGESLNASMGLRDWVSEKGRLPRRRRARRRASFNGAPRLGLGEGWLLRRHSFAYGILLQWGSETGSRRRVRRFDVAPYLDGTLQWGSETGSRRRIGAVGGPRWIELQLQWGSETGSRRRGIVKDVRARWGRCFNGAPRLGLGEGLRRPGLPA